MDCHTPVSAVADTTSASTPAANEVSTPDPTRLSNKSAGAADAAIAIARSVNKTRRQSNCQYENKNKLTIEISRALQHAVADEHRRVQVAEAPRRGAAGRVCSRPARRRR
jgi:hypothetical protein